MSFETFSVRQSFSLHCVHCTTFSDYSELSKCSHVHMTWDGMDNQTLPFRSNKLSKKQATVKEAILPLWNKSSSSSSAESIVQLLTEPPLTDMSHKPSSKCTSCYSQSLTN